MKKIVTIYFSDDWYKDIPLSNVLTRSAFEQWCRIGEDMGVEVYRASIEWLNNETGEFEKAWTFKDEKWQKISGPIKPDLIYDKLRSEHDYEMFEMKKKICQKVRMYNDPQFRAIVGNKLSQYVLFREFMPKSFIANNEKDLKNAIKKIKSSKIVVKPVYGSGGDGIIIDDRSNILNHEFIFPALVQEFIVSEKGIPNFSKNDEVSDLRLVFNDHKLEYALSRIAKPGSLFTNLHQGATGKIVPKEFIPQSIWKMTKKVIKRLSFFKHAQYSIDFIFDNQGKPFLIELNTTPGMDLIYSLGEKEIFYNNFKSIADLID